MNKEAIL